VLKNITGVHDYLVVFLHTETQRNKYLVVSITNETASLLLPAAISYSHADSAMIKLVTIQWTGNFTMATHFVFHTFPAEGDLCPYASRILRFFLKD